MSSAPAFRCAFVGLALLIASCSPERSERSAPLNRDEVRQEFEKDSGFEFPKSATQVEGLSGNEDFHGDYDMVLTFVVPLADIAAFTHLPASEWLHPEDLKPLTKAKDISKDVNLSTSGSNYQVSAGTLYIDQWGPKDSNRKLAVKPETGRVIYARRTW